MISSFVYLCPLIFEKTHLDLITRNRHCLILFLKMSLIFFNCNKKKEGFEIETIEVVI
jgi:hypothetical protein